MTASEQILFDLAKEVKEMRDLQKEYFRTRDKGVLGRSKSKERQVDILMDQIISNLKDK